MGFVINEDETLEDLQLKKLFILQKKDAFRFGMDAVLLANFAKAKAGSRVMDLGTGTGILPILLSAKTDAKEIIGIEIQPEIADMARRSIMGNGLESRVMIDLIDIKIATKRFGAGSFDVVVSNPPYTKTGSGLVNPAESKAIARHEILCTLQDVLQTASALLRYHGDFFMVHRADRLCDIMVEMRNHHLEPKALRMVCPREGEAPSLILVHGLKKGNPGLKNLPPLYIYDSEGQHTLETKIYYGIKDRKDIS